jgi:hypothetical protein
MHGMYAHVDVHCTFYVYVHCMRYMHLLYALYAHVHLLIVICATRTYIWRGPPPLYVQPMSEVMCLADYETHRKAHKSYSLAHLAVPYGGRQDARLELAQVHTNAHITSLHV